MLKYLTAVTDNCSY